MLFTLASARTFPGGSIYFVEIRGANETLNQGDVLPARTHGVRRGGPEHQTPLQRGDTIKDLGMGRIDPKEATAVGYLAAGMLKALQQGDIETRLRALEAVEGSKSQKSRSKVNHDDPPAPVPRSTHG